MKKTLLFALGLSGTVIADDGPTARKLETTWGGHGGAATGNDDDGCKFIPIADIFKFHMDAYDAGTWTNVAHESQIDKHNTLFQGMPIANFVEAEIEIATVDIVFSLPNYDAAAQTLASTEYGYSSGRADADSNYIYHKWASNAWATDTALDTGRTADLSLSDTTSETRRGTQRMATVCFFKPGYRVTNNLNQTDGEMEFDYTLGPCDENGLNCQNAPTDGLTVCSHADFIYPVLHESLPNIQQSDIKQTSSGNYADTTEYDGARVQRTINSHKTLGVSTTCGTDDDESNSNIHDVFTWAVAKATGTLEYEIKVHIDRGSDNHEIFLSNNPINGENITKHDTPQIYVTVTLEQTHKTVPHDLLYISGNFDPGEQEGIYNFQDEDDHEDFILQMGAVMDGKVQWVDDDDGTADGTFDIKIDCTAELTVTSADDQWHCFDGAEGVPTSSDFATHSDTVYDTTNGGDGTAMTGSDTTPDCKAHLTQQCIINTHSIHIEDSRHCYNVNDGEPNDEVCAEDEFKNRWPAIAPKTTVDFDAHAAIVQAIRLNNVRRYPLGDAATADLYTAKKVTNDDYTTLASTYARSNSKFVCDDDDCSTKDPYVVLAAEDQDEGASRITVNCFSDDGTGSYDDPTDIKTGCDDDPYVKPGCQNPSQHPVTCTTESPNRLPGGSDQVTLQLPPPDFPQFYVFGISTLRSYVTGEYDTNTEEFSQSTTTQSDVTADHDTGTANGTHTPADGNFSETSNLPDPTAHSSSSSFNYVTDCIYTEGAYSCGHPACDGLFAMGSGNPSTEWCTNCYPSTPGGREDTLITDEVDVNLLYTNFIHPLNPDTEIYGSYCGGDQPFDPLRECVWIEADQTTFTYTIPALGCENINCKGMVYLPGDGICTNCYGGITDGSGVAEPSENHTLIDQNTDIAEVQAYYSNNNAQFCYDGLTYVNVTSISVIINDDLDPNTGNTNNTDSSTYTPQARRLGHKAKKHLLGAKIGHPASHKVLSERTSFIAAETAIASK